MAASGGASSPSASSLPSPPRRRAVSPVALGGSTSTCPRSGSAGRHVLVVGFAAFVIITVATPAVRLRTRRACGASLRSAASVCAPCRVARICSPPHCALLRLKHAFATPYLIYASKLDTSQTIVNPLAKPHSYISRRKTDNGQTRVRYSSYMLVHDTYSGCSIRATSLCVVASSCAHHHHRPQPLPCGWPSRRVARARALPRDASASLRSSAPCSYHARPLRSPSPPTRSSARGPAACPPVRSGQRTRPPQLASAPRACAQPSDPARPAPGSSLAGRSGLAPPAAARSGRPPPPGFPRPPPGSRPWPLASTTLPVSGSPSPPQRPAGRATHVAWGLLLPRSLRRLWPRPRAPSVGCCRAPPPAPPRLTQHPVFAPLPGAAPPAPAGTPSPALHAARAGCPAPGLRLDRSGSPWPPLRVALSDRLPPSRRPAARNPDGRLPRNSASRPHLPPGRPDRLPALRVLAGSPAQPLWSAAREKGRGVIRLEKKERRKS
nr:basic proline-rich protein-like [Aegilops tauschii subsp. strangulata]